MSRDRTRTRESMGRSPTGGDGGEDSTVGLDEETPTAGGRTTEDGGLRERAASRATRLFSPRRFLLALVLTVVGLFAANAFVPLPGSGLLGVFLATFLFGLALEDRRYAEAALAGGVTVGASVFLDFAVVAVLGGFGVPLGLLGAAAGAAAGVVGTYFGRDLRNGLTRDVP